MMGVMAEVGVQDSHHPNRVNTDSGVPPEVLVKVSQASATGVADYAV
jgi:hypothetical protein